MEDVPVVLMHLKVDVIGNVDTEFLFDRIFRIRHELSTEGLILGGSGDKLTLHLVRRLYCRLHHRVHFRSPFLQSQDW